MWVSDVGMAGVLSDPYLKEKLGQHIAIIRLLEHTYTYAHRHTHGETHRKTERRERERERERERKGRRERRIKPSGSIRLFRCDRDYKTLVPVTLLPSHSYGHLVLQPQP